MARDESDTGALLSIGGLAAASGLSPKALRMYAESGLLPPRHVDPFSGYRSYGSDQVERARLIAALRGIGMGLARIQVLCDLDAQSAIAELRSWWRQEEADVSSRGAAVDSLTQRLGALHQEGTMMTTSTHTPIQLAAAAHRGHVRPVQQDSVITRHLPGGAALLAVADGFGADDALSARILDAFTTALEDAAPQLSPADPLRALEAAWAAAERRVPTPDPTPEERADGATLTAVLLDGDRLHIAHIGDTRATLVRGGRIEAITQEHTHVRSLAAAGRLSPDEAATHPDRAVLNRALAHGAPTSPDVLVRRLQPGDLVLVASDGLHAVVDPAAIAEVLTGPFAARTGLDTLTAQLVTLALDAGGPDNIGVALARCGDPDDN